MHPRFILVFRVQNGTRLHRITRCILVFIPPFRTCLGLFPLIYSAFDMVIAEPEVGGTPSVNRLAAFRLAPTFMRASRLAFQACLGRFTLIHSELGGAQHSKYSAPERGNTPKHARVSERRHFIP